MHFRRAIVAIIMALSLGAGGVAVANSANAATVTGTVNAPTVKGSNFDYSCDINPGGSTIYVAGRSWEAVGGGSFVETPKVAISGTNTQRVTFKRDGNPNTTYRYRCVWFVDATTTALLGRTVSTVDVTTGLDPLLGASVAAIPGETFSQALVREDAEYAPKIVRVYYSSLPSTSAIEPRNNVKRPVVSSFKDDPVTLASGAHDGILNAWLDLYANSSYDVWVSYYHEPEDNFTTQATMAQYRTGFQHFANLVHAKNNPKLHTVQIFMDWDWDKASKNPDGTKRVWTDWYAGDAAVDYIGADMYNFQDKDASAAYQPIATHVLNRNWVADARVHGKPLMVPEIGFADPNAQPAFLHELGQWARDNGVFVQYWDQAEYRLNTATAQQAWREEIAKTP